MAQRSVLEAFPGLFSAIWAQARRLCPYDQPIVDKRSTEYDHFRAGIERFLELAKALRPEMQNRILEAIRLRHDDALARALIVDTEAEEVGSHFLNELAAARDALEPDQEAELTELAMAGLTDWPLPPKRYGDP
jgi:hypothetical protein